MSSKRPATNAASDTGPGDRQGAAEHALGMLLRQAYFALRRCSNASAARWGANGDQFVLLGLLAESDGVTQQDLVARGGYDATTTSNMLRLLEQRKLVRRVPCPQDGRAKRVQLTRAGRQLHDRLWQGAAGLRRGLAESVNRSQRAAFEQCLHQITVAMERLRLEYEQPDDRTDDQTEIS